MVWHRAEPIVEKKHPSAMSPEYNTFVDLFKGDPLLSNTGNNSPTGSFYNVYTWGFQLKKTAKKRFGGAEWEENRLAALEGLRNWRFEIARIAAHGARSPRPKASAKWPAKSSAKRK